MNLISLKFIIIILTVCGCASFARAGEPFSMEVVGRWGGPVNDVEVVGNTAYIGSGSRMVILDVTDAANIIEIGSIDLVVPVTDITVRGDYAYVCTIKESPASCLSSYGFCTVDISDPAHPQLASFDVDGPGTLQPREVQIHSDVAFVTWVGGVEMYNISDPYQVNWIHHVSSWAPVPFSPRCIQVVGDLLYIASDNLGTSLRIYNLQPDPLNPALLGEAAYPDFGIDTSIDPISLHVSGGMAAITARVIGLPSFQNQIVMFFDVTSPSQPALASTYNQFGGAFVTDVVLSGNYAFVADYAAPDSPVISPSLWQQTKGLVVLDISDPSNPFEAASVKTHGAVRGVRISGDRAYVMDDGEGMIIFDVSNPVSPQRLGNYHSPAFIRDIAKDGDLLYVADQWNGFSILDVSDPQAGPQLVGVYQTPLPPGGPHTRIDHRAIEVHDGHAYLFSYWFGLQVVDVSNPASPQLVDEVLNPTIVIGGVPYQTGPRGLEMTGDIIHTTYQLRCPVGQPICLLPDFWVFRNYDASNPSQLELLASVLMPDAAAAIRMAIDSEGLAFCGRQEEAAGSYQIIDTSPSSRPPFSNPSVVYTSTLQHCTGAALNGSTLLLGNESPVSTVRGLYLLDITDPLSPQQIAHITSATQGIHLAKAWDVVAQNDRAYVFGQARPNPSCPSSSSPYVLAFDISDPASPVLLDYVVVSSDAVAWDRGHLLVDEPYLYAAGGPSAATMPDLVPDGLTVIRLNGIPSACPADINSSGAVDVFDLFVLLGNWSANGPGAGLAPPSNVVDVFDLFELLSAWGPCPTRAAHNMK